MDLLEYFLVGPSDLFTCISLLTNLNDDDQ